MLAAAARLKDWFGLTPSDRCLSVSTPFYSHGLKVTVFTPLLTGGSIAIPANPGMVDLREWFHALQPTWYSAAPTLHRAVLDKARASAGLSAKHRLRFVISGGAALPQAVREGLQATLVVPVLEHYGSSEAAQIAANLPPPGPSKPGTCGMPWPGTVMIVDEDGSPVHPGDQGEVWVRGPTVMPGYLNDQDSNRRSFVDSWLRTGDLGSLDADGFLSLHGRLNEVINRGGEKISPGEIDGALLRHPAVAEAAAFALPHSRLGEDVAAAVVLHPGATATSADLRQFLQGGLAPFKIPRRIRILDQLPKGMTGKVQRRRLAEVFSATTSHATTPHAPFLEAELLQLWRHLLGSERLTIDDDFFESGGDSLLATEMLLEVERLIGHRVSETIMFKAATVRQVALQLTAQPAPQTCVHSYGSGDQRPLFFFHGDFDNGAVQIRQLVRLLGPDQPIVTIDPHGLRGEPIPPSFEEMAADRLQLILQKQASGPFMLGGKCNGAMVAFETARLLRAAGHKVDMVVMVDPPTVCARPIMRMILRLMRPAVSPLRLGWVHGRMARAERLLSTSPIQILTNAYHHLVSKGFEPPSPSPPWEGYMHAMSRYLPAPLDVPVVFYAATHNGRPWRRISSNLEVVEVPGGHDHCLTIGAETVATHLRQRIACLTS
jgi:thioesterase domain-containing protein/acyl carrier protein